jgi:hypothetical protein
MVTVMKYHSKLKAVGKGRLDRFGIGSFVTLGDDNTLYHVINKSTGMVHLLQPGRHVTDTILVPGYRDATKYLVVREPELPLFSQNELF